jgi:hypothetical protein
MKCHPAVSGRMLRSSSAHVEESTNGVKSGITAVAPQVRAIRASRENLYHHRSRLRIQMFFCNQRDDVMAFAAPGPCRRTGLGLCFGMLVRLFRGRQSLLLENLASHQQLVVLKRRHPRPSLALFDKLFLGGCSAGLVVMPSMGQRSPRPSDR